MQNLITQAFPEFARAFSNGQILGDKLVFGDQDNMVSVSFDIGSTISEYHLLRLKWVRPNTEVEKFQIDVSQKEFETKKRNVQNLKGGYFWTYDNKWYNWAPNSELIANEIKKILLFCGIITDKV